MSEPDRQRNSDNFCYRHPDRQSFVLCQRCLRTICPECQTPLPVGVICPECLAEQQKTAAKVTRMPRRRTRVSRFTGNTPVTTSIVALTVVVYLVTLIPVVGSQIEGALLLWGPYLYPDLSGTFQPWRLLTVMLLHGSFWHVALNMLALWMLGQSLEPLLGPKRFLWLYLLSGLGGSVAAVLFGFLTPVVGASGAIFGLFGAILVIGRHIGANIRGIVLVLGINLAFTFVPLLLGQRTGVSWQAHIGGLLVGLLVGYIYARTRAVRQARTQTFLLIGTAVGLLVLLGIPAVVYV